MVFQGFRMDKSPTKLVHHGWRNLVFQGFRMAKSPTKLVHHGWWKFGILGLWNGFTPHIQSIDLERFGNGETLEWPQIPSYHQITMVKEWRNYGISIKTSDWL